MKIDISIKEIEGEGYLCIRLADLTVLKRSKAFKPPSIEEVKEYCKERNNSVDPAQFVFYNEARGWYLSKGVKMKDWKAAVITWEKNAINNPINQTPKGTNVATPPPEDFGVFEDKDWSRKKIN